VAVVAESVDAKAGEGRRLIDDDDVMCVDSVCVSPLLPTVESLTALARGSGIVGAYDVRMECELLNEVRSRNESFVDAGQHWSEPMNFRMFASDVGRCNSVTPEISEDVDDVSMRLSDVETMMLYDGSSHIAQTEMSESAGAPVDTLSRCTSRDTFEDVSSRPSPLSSDQTKVTMAVATATRGREETVGTDETCRVSLSDESVDRCNESSCTFRGLCATVRKLIAMEKEELDFEMELDGNDVTPIVTGDPSVVGGGSGQKQYDGHSVPLDVTVEAMLSKRHDGSVSFDGFSFRSFNQFRLYFIASKSGLRTWRAVALSLTDDDCLDSWYSRLRTRVSSMTQFESRLSGWESEAARLWSMVGSSPKEPDRHEDATSGSDVIVRQMSVQQNPALLCEPRHKKGLFPRVAARVGRASIVALNDTGADVSVMSYSTYLKLGLPMSDAPTGVAVWNADGSPFTIRGVLQTVIVFGEGAAMRSLPLKAVVLEELQTDLILGDDFLRENHAIIAYGANHIQYQDFAVPVLDPVDCRDKEYRNTEGLAVRALDDVRLSKKGRSAIVAFVKLPRSFEYSQYSWRFEPSAMAQLVFGIRMAPTIVRLHGMDTVAGVLLVNPADKELVVPRGSVLGSIHCLREATLDAVTVQSITATATATDNRATSSAPSETSVDDSFRKKIDEIVSDLGEGVTAEQQQQLRELLLQYKHVLAADKLGSTNIFTFDIDPGNARPVCHRDRRYTPLEYEAIRTQVESLLANGLIESANSDWCSRLVCAPKKAADGQRTDIRVCVDFRDVNKLCVKDAYPSPNIEATLDRLKSAKWFSAFDLEKGYHQVPLTERAKQICTFRCPLGAFRYTRLPFGIMNAPAAFQRMMDLLLRGLSWSCAMVYMDDVIVFSSSWEEHMKNLRMVLDRLASANLTVKLSKCQFARKEVNWLGYVVSEGGITPDPTKVDRVLAFARPTSLADVRTFLGLAGVFRKFIPGYGDIARPLHQLTKKEAHSRWRAGTAWDEDCEVSFEALKVAVATRPLLAHPRTDRPMKVVCDASDHGMGAMLAQDDENGVERPIAFASATFADEATRYTTTEKEGLAVVWAVKHFRPYIHGVPTVIVTDHSALSYIFAMGDPPPRIARWVMELAQYDLSYIHRKGSCNSVADALSRLETTMKAGQEVFDGTEFAEPKVLRLLTSEDPHIVVRMVGTRRSSRSKSHAETKRQEAVSFHPPDGRSAGVGAVDDVELQNQDVPLVHDHDGVIPVDGHDIPTEKATNSGETMEGKDDASPTFLKASSADDGDLPVDVSPSIYSALQHEDDDCRVMLKWLQCGTVPEDQELRTWVEAHQDEYAVQQGVLYRIDTAKTRGMVTTRLLAVVPKSQRRQLMMTYHDSPAFGGHMNGVRTYARVRQHFWWPRMCSDILDYVAVCPTCAIRRPRTRPKSQIQSHVQASSPFEFVAMDLLAMPESKSGNKYALVLVDYYSRYAIVSPLPDKSAKTVARVLLEKCILVHGHPGTILTDRGGEFLNEILISLCKALSIKKTFTTPYHPESDGVVERFNRTLLKLIAAYASADQDTWDEVLPYVLYAFNTSVSRATGCVPFTLIFGREPPPALYFDVLEPTGVVRKESDPAKWREEVRRCLDESMVESAQMEAHGTREKERFAVNQSKPVPPEFPLGTVVVIRNEGRLAEGAKAKLALKQRGLFVVTRWLSPVTVRLRRVGDASQKQVTVHVDFVQPLRASRRKLMVTKDVNLLVVPVEKSDGLGEEVEEFEVEEVRGFRLRDGHLELLVNWKGYQTADDQWLREDRVDCAALVESFLATSGAERLMQI
jgi:hypothetical protein